MIDFISQGLLMIMGFIMGLVATIFFGHQFENWSSAIHTVNTINTLKKQYDAAIDERKKLQKSNDELLKQNQLLRDTNENFKSRESELKRTIELLSARIDNLEQKL